jgi:methyltransferase (TIGR00027 family)
MTVGRLRHIQAVHEPVASRNPDTHVRRLLPLSERWRLAWMPRKQLEILRKDPFYYYIVARTRYFDEVFLDAIHEGVATIINVGCGSDTRAHRFAAKLQAHGVQVLECDQKASIQVKQRLAKRFGPAPHLEYLALDLNDGAWPAFEARINVACERPTLVLMEGVSPYIENECFVQLLLLLRKTLRQQSKVVYDFKLQGVDDAFGSSRRTLHPFRLPSTRSELVAFHEQLGYRLHQLDFSEGLTRRFVPALHKSAAAGFAQDALVRLEVDG